ncbi:MAG: hypothetical protein WBS17_00825 [Candidatus Acidiferrales bacterium]
MADPGDKSILNSATGQRASGRLDTGGKASEASHETRGGVRQQNTKF